MACSLLLLCTLLLQPPASLQNPVQDVQQTERAVVVVNAWLGSDRSDRTLLEDAVEALLEAGQPAYRFLAEVLRQATEGQDRHAASGLESVVTSLCLDFMQREIDSEMVYAGQYDDLRVLMPYTGRLYMGLLLDTPDWFPENLRWQVVAPLRDLYLSSPGEDVLADMQRIAEDENFETNALRVALRYALAQWGSRGLVAREIEDLERDSGEGDTEDQLFAVRKLADVHYQIRDYKESARVHKEFLTRAKASGFPLTPVDYYNAACNFSLTGDLESAYAALDACAELQMSDRVDSSLKLERSLFDKDPDIRAVRGTQRFEKIVEKAFGKKKGSKGERGV